MSYADPTGRHCYHAGHVFGPDGCPACRRQQHCNRRDYFLRIAREYKERTTCTECVSAHVDAARREHRRALQVVT